ncbi:hypothetical protein [Klebsiella spallanzanii]|uniref:hypothetical protein n=1 Tax=Klebsiella spallanzanii TaxID=2587528 RepID=UPI002593A9BC|nr:hypothetical protein [Klebsiella spallanzanii]MDM4209667.1 hypothetical protein [Klebsiella spallanzanii]
MQLIPMIDLIPCFYERITNLYPDKPWIEMVEKIEQTRHAFPHRVGQAMIDNWFSFALTRWDRKQIQLFEGNDWADLVGAMSLAKRVSALCESIQNGGEGPRELHNRFRGAIQNPSDLRAIHFELFVVERLKLSGCRIHWPVENKGEETFDLLVKPSNDLPEFELECKSFAGDKGASATLEDGQRLLEACIKTLGVDGLFKLFPAQPGVASIMSIKLEKEIPRDERKLTAFANSVLSVIKCEYGDENYSFKIEHSYCEISGNTDDPDACFNASLKLPGATLAFAVSGAASEGWQGIRIAYTGKVTLFEKAEETAKKAFKKQLTGTRPGAIALQFTNETAEFIRNSNLPGNRYRALADKIFTKEHAALVVIAGDIEPRPILPSVSPYSPSAFMAEHCTFAAFDNQKGNHPNSKLKTLFK